MLRSHSTEAVALRQPVNCVNQLGLVFCTHESFIYPVFKHVVLSGQPASSLASMVQ